LNWKGSKNDGEFSYTETWYWLLSSKNSSVLMPQLKSMYQLDKNGVVNLKPNSKSEIVLKQGKGNL